MRRIFTILTLLTIALATWSADTDKSFHQVSHDSKQEAYALTRDSLDNNKVKTMPGGYEAKARPASNDVRTYNEELRQEKEKTDRNYRRFILWSIIMGIVLLLAIALLVYAFWLKVKSNRFLRELQRVREAFFANITHEFRSPLTLIHGMSQKAKDATADNLEEVHEAGAMAERAVNRLTDLINQLLDIAKVQGNTDNMEWKHGNIVAYLSMLLESYQQLANMRGIELLYTPERNNIQMDIVPDYFQKIVSNLLSNALKHTPENGRVSVTVKTTGTTDGNGKDGKGRLVLTVADNGNGIDKTDLPYIFNPFFQGKDNQHEIGTGLGLSLVKQIIDSLDGTIGVVTAEGEGTAFTVTLPLKGKADTSPGELMAVEPAAMKHLNSNIIPPTTCTDTKETETEGEDYTPRILIVEDNSDVAYYIGSQLEKEYNVAYANNGRVGLLKAGNLVPDLIVTDLMMPEMDGLELCRRIRSSESMCHIPIIIISAKTSEAERIKGIHAGADAYLFKPFNDEELQTRIRTLLARHRMLRQKYETPVIENFIGKPDEMGKNRQNLSKRDAELIGHVTDIVYTMMQQGSIDVKTLASHLCMSQSQFRRKFTAITGQTPASYIMQIRLSNAKRLIDAHPDWSIGEVAEHCGFADTAHFTNAFKRAFAITPTQYAHRARTE